MKKILLKLFFITNLCLCAFFLNACALIQDDDDELNYNDDELAVDTSTFQLPDIPEDLQNEQVQTGFNLNILPYIVLVKVVTPENENNKENTSEIEKFIAFFKEKNEENEELIALFKEKSTLFALQSTLPASRLALDSRILQDEAEALNILHSLGYYSASINAEADYTSFPIQIHFTLHTHEQFKILSTDILYPEQYLDPEFPEHASMPTRRPKDLSFFPADRLNNGDPAIAANILNAIDKIEPWFHNRGFPFAKLEDTKYYAYTDNSELETEIYFNPRQYTRFGSIIIEGSEQLNVEYIEKLHSWKKGDPWNSRRVASFQERLLNTGIFSFVSVAPDTEENTEERNVIVTLADGPPRSIGAGLNYDLTRGVGTQFFWEHRNFSGNAEYVRADTTIWEDTQEVRFKYLKPNITIYSHNFITEVIFKQERTDAYDVQLTALDMGFEQPIKLNFLEKDLNIAYYVHLELGIEDDSVLAGEEYYHYAGLPLRFQYRDTNGVTDPSRGYLIATEIGPYTGKYSERFSLLLGKFLFTKYLEVIEDKELILAFKANAGSIYPVHSYDVPASLRFYVGGGSSIRGYAYQAVGPKNLKGNPLGGTSFIEGSFEIRYKVMPELALVPFIDMGNAYEEYLPTDFEFKYGAGLGVRYFTAIGPIRFDLAFPVFDEEKDEKDFQIYVSIGQTF